MIAIYFFLVFIQNYSTATNFPGQEISRDKIYVNENLTNHLNKYINKNITYRTNIYNKQIEQLKNISLSFDKFMDCCLYHKKFGYYTTGKVNLGGHFFTYPMQMSPNFGAMIAYQAYSMWQSMLTSNDIKQDETFYICEFGAGTGTLAKDVLDTIEHYSNQEEKHSINTFWKEFNNKIKYIIFEKSPHLITKQFQTNKKYILKKKFCIKKNDALTDSNENKYKGLILSNELIDAFSVHKILQQGKKIKVCILIPHLTNQWLLNLAPNEKEFIITQRTEIDNLLNNLIKQNEIYIDHNSFNNLFIKKNDSKWVKLNYEVWISLRCKLLKKIEQKLTNKPEDEKFEKTKQYIALFDKNVHFMEYYIDSSYFPEIQNYLNRHANYIKKLGIISKFNFNECVWYINYSSEAYFKNISKILESGFIITIDYGKDSSIHINQFLTKNGALRTYPPNSEPNNRHIYNKIGYIDMTADVNFTDLYLMGKEHGFENVYYGMQSVLNGSSIDISRDKTIVDFDINNKNFTYYPNKKFDNQYNFKILIQKKTSKANYFKISAKTEMIIPSI